MNPITIFIEILALVVGVAAGYFFHRYQVDRATKAKQDKADDILKAANTQARMIESSARENATRIIQAAESEIKERRIELNRETERLDKRRAELDSRFDKMEQREQNLNRRQSQIDRRGNEIDKLHEEQMKRLEQIAQMTPDDARKDLFAAVEKEARGDMARIIRQIEAEAREEGEKRARKLIADAIQRVASEHVAEVTRAVVTLPSEEMKGRIVGRNGRNIKAFEQAAGVDVIVDDTPDSVTISCFDSVRREIARRALSKLVLDLSPSPVSTRCAARSPAARSRSWCWMDAFIPPTLKRSSTMKPKPSKRSLTKPVSKPPTKQTSRACIPKSCA